MAPNRRKRQPRVLKAIQGRTNPLQFLSQLFELRTIGSDSISAGPGGFPCIRSSPLAFMHVLYPPQYVVLFHAFNACLVASYICLTLTSTLRHILIFMSLTAA